MSANKLIDKLEQLGIVDAKTIGKLRKQVAESPKRVSPRSIVRYLVDRKKISRDDADQLLESIAKESAPDRGQATVAMTARNKEMNTDELLGEPFQVSVPPEPGRATIVDIPEKPREPQWNVAAPIDPVEMIPVSEPMMDEFPPSGGMGGTAAVSGTQPYTTRVVHFTGKKVQGNPWESKWLFLGFGLLSVLVATTIGLWWFLNLTSADDAFAAAEKKFIDGDFGSARELYLEFSEKFKSDSKVPLAKAKAVNAELRSAYNSENWALTRVAAIDKLPKLLAEPDNRLTDIQEDLSVILPKTALGLSQMAVTAGSIEEKRTLLQESNDVYALVSNSAYVPSSRLRAEFVAQTLAERQKNVDQVDYEVRREETYESKLQSIGALADQGDTNQASIEYHDLVETYPILRTRQPLIDLVAKISAKESQLVTPIDLKLNTTNEDDVSKALARSMIVTQVGLPVADLENKAIPYLVNGTIFVLNAADGSIIWSRRVGYETTIQPQWVGNPHESDLIVCDQSKHEVLRLAVADGKVVWRTQIQEPFFAPAITRGAVFVTTGDSDKSKVIRLDIDNGGVVCASQLPQSVNVGPLAHGDVSVLYQMGRHSSLYILSQENLTCVEVYYLGHQPNTVACVPFLLSGNLCILINGAQQCQAYVLGFKSSGVGASEAQPPFKITDGKVTLAPFRYGRSVIISSDTGDLRMFELVVSLEGDQSTATMQPQVTGAFPAQPGVANYFVADRGDLYLGNRGLTKYRIQKADEEFEIRKTGDTTDLFVGPIFPFERALIHLRRRFRSSMFTAAAVNPESLEEIWRTDFGAPPLGQPFVVDQRLMTFSEQGDLFELTSQGFETGTVRHLIPGSEVKENLDFDRRLQLSDGSFALVGINCDRVLAYRSTGTGESRLSPLQAPANRPGGEAEAFGKHVLFSSLDGQVVRVDPWTGSVIGAPFQPAVNPNQTIRWSRPAVFAEQNVFVIGTDSGSVYKVLADGEQSLIRQAELELPGAIVSPLIVIGDRCVGITRAEGVDKISVYQVFPDLVESASQPLDAMFTGHLAAFGDAFYVTTADGKLHCLGADLSPKWQADLPAKLVDAPQDAGASIVLTFDNGDIQRLDKANGQVLSSVQLDWPLAHNPLEYNGHWYVNDPQGVVLVVPPLE